MEKSALAELSWSALKPWARGGRDQRWASGGADGTRGSTRAPPPFLLARRKRWSVAAAVVLVILVIFPICACRGASMSMGGSASAQPARQRARPRRDAQRRSLAA